MEDINILVFQWIYGSRKGLSPTCFSSNKTVEAYEFYTYRISSGFFPPIILKDLLDMYANSGNAEELREMFSMLDANYADQRLISLKDYVLNRWLK